MPIEKINVPLVLSYDTASNLAFARSTTDGREQRRENCIYEITRGAQGADPTVTVCSRPGVTDVGNTYGAATQVQYIVGNDPNAAWNAYAAWVAVKDGNDNKVVSSSTATTVLSSADYVPRFMQNIRLGGTQYALLQLQNKTSPAATSDAQKVYYSSAIATWTQINAASFTAFNVRGMMVELDGWLLAANGEDDGIYNQVTQNDPTAAFTDKITISSTFDEIQGLGRLRRRVLAWGRETVELFEIPSPGNATGSILNRVNNTVERVGLGDIAGPASIDGKGNYFVQVNDMIFYLGRFGNVGNDHNLVCFDGNRHFKISREYEDKMMSTATVYELTRWSFHGRVAVAILFTHPNAATQKWLAYFPDMNEFFYASSTVFSPRNNGLHYHGVNPQKLYYYASTNKWQDDSTSFPVVIQFSIPNKDNSRRMAFLAGVVGTTMASTDNLGIQFSTDNGANWTAVRNIDMSKMAKFVRKVPSHRELMVRLSYTGSQELRLQRYYMDSEV
jgi:hypothetical protein